MIQINPLHNMTQSGISTRETNTASELSFKDLLNNALNEISELEETAENGSNALATGEVDDLHSIMIDTEKADIALQLTIQIRNKILDAYNEIMRMQI